MSCKSLVELVTQVKNDKWTGDFTWTSLWIQTISKARKLYLRCHHVSSHGLHSNLHPLEFFKQIAHSNTLRSFSLVRGSQVLNLSYSCIVWLYHSKSHNLLFTYLESDCSIALIYFLFYVFISLCGPRISTHTFLLDGELVFYLKMIYFLENDLELPLIFALFLKVKQNKKENFKCDSLFGKCGLWKTKSGLRGQVTYREGTVKTVAPFQVPKIESLLIRWNKYDNWLIK